MRRLADWLFILAGAIVATGIVRQLDRKSDPLWLVFGAGVALMYLIIFLSVLAHEGGHALAVRLQGRRIQAFAVLPLVLHFDPFRVEWTFWLGDEAELAGAVAFDDWDEGDPARSRIWVAVAGPIASLILAAAALIAANLWIDGGALAERVAPLLRALALYSLALGMLNLIPYPGSDGDAIRKALRRGPG